MCSCGVETVGLKWRQLSNPAERVDVQLCVESFSGFYHTLHILGAGFLQVFLFELLLMT